MTADGARGGLEDSPFTYKETKDGMVLVYWRGALARVLKGTRARAFLLRMSSLSVPGQQLEMARVTGNFKRGNER